MIRIVGVMTGDKSTRREPDNYLIVRINKSLYVTVPETDEVQYAFGDAVQVGPAPEYEVK